MPQIQEGIRGDLLENASDSSMKSTSVPFFEFSVTSEEGINLFVDISSSSLDWSKRLKNEVCLCQAFQENKFQSFRQELEYLQKNCKQVNSSFIYNRNSRSRMETDRANTDLSPDSFNRENDHLVVKSTDADNGSLQISEIKQCKVLHEVLEHVEQEEKVSTFCGRDSGVKGLVISNTTSSNHEKIEPLVGKVFCASQANPTSCFTEILAANEPKPTWDCQNTELWSKTCLNVDIKNESCEVKVGVPFSVTSAINTRDMQSSEVAGLCKDVEFSPFISDALPNLFNTLETIKMEDEVSNSIEIDQNGHFKSSSVQEQARDCGVNIAEASCISGKKVDMSNGGHKRKRHCNHSDKGYGLHSGRTLRSAKHHNRQGLLRRSKRLFSM
ncbi:hypothetical protein ACH5RR_032104 [Cinchona calisaya]|uniref:Uncharacterized protein n=1 Tax=Cinchona calisaya TaxID=153742 RepID=A0ABD2YK76_9GENT